MIPESEPLTVELEAALLRELRRCYDWENYARFRDRLVRPVLVLTDSPRKLGEWRRAGRMLSISRTLVLERPWSEVVAVLEHEMAHQFVDEVLHIHDETAHGATFAKVCAERGIDGRATGAPVPVAGVDGERVLDRIRKLLALAGSSNQHEAELGMRTAHELMLRHNIDEAAARTDRAFEVRHVGDPTRRGSRLEAGIVGLLTEFFFVEAIRIPVYLPRLGKRGHVFEIVGTRPNVEMACHVHAFLLSTCDRLWRANRGDARVRSGRDRLAYQCGVIAGFRAKLVLERTELRGTGLVWRGDRGLEAFYRARHPKIVTARHSTSINAAHAAGREAGATIVIHRPVESKSATNAARLRLGGGSGI
jgi:hypothetical protein